MIRYYPANLLTGDLYPFELPLESVKMGGSLDAGRFTAQLDMRKMVDSPHDFASAREVLAALRVGTCTIAAIIETDPAVILGEWWLTSAPRTRMNPRITLAGTELSGYLRHRVVERRWRRVGEDPIALAGALISECFRGTAYVALDRDGWVSPSGAKVTVEYRTGSQTYWDAVDDVVGDARFEWYLSTSLETSSSGAARRVLRALQISEPTIRSDRTDIVLEATAPGSHPAGVLDYAEDDPVDAYCFELHGFGSGYGTDQITSYKERDRPEGMPRLSATLQTRDADTQPALDRAVGRGLRAANPAYRPFEVTVNPAYLPDQGPRVGDVYSWRAEPSLSVPDVHGGAVRVLDWSWAPSTTGLDEVILTVQRD